MRTAAHHGQLYFVFGQNHRRGRADAGDETERKVNLAQEKQPNFTMLKSNEEARLIKRLVRFCGVRKTEFLIWK